MAPSPVRKSSEIPLLQNHRNAILKVVTQPVVDIPPSQIQTSPPEPTSKLQNLLQSKMAQLDVEIDRYKNDNRRLEEKKKDFEKVQADFITEKRKFDDLMAGKLQEFEQMKRQEMNKIKREKSALDQLRTQVHSLASEKNSSEMTKLRELLRRAEQDMSEKDDRHKQEVVRLKSDIKRLQAEVEELKKSNEFLERQRLQEKVQSNKKPVQPLRSDTRQNIESIHRRSYESSEPSKHRDNGDNFHNNQMEEKQDVETHEQEDESQPAESCHAGAVSNVIASMDEGQVKLLTQWLDDVELSLVEDDEKCIATLEKEFPDGKIEVTRSDGSRRIVFANGTIKITGPNGTPVFICFFNRDMKKVTTDGVVYYYYADTQTIQTTFLDGLEVMEFSTGQVEKKYPNGTQDVVSLFYFIFAFLYVSFSNRYFPMAR